MVIVCYHGLCNNEYLCTHFNTECLKWLFVQVNGVHHTTCIWSIRFASVVGVWRSHADFFSPRIWFFTRSYLAEYARNKNSEVTFGCRMQRLKTYQKSRFIENYFFGPSEKYDIAQKMLFTPPDRKNQCSPKITSSTYVINHLLLFPNMWKLESHTQHVIVKKASELRILSINCSRKWITRFTVD